MSRYIGHFRHKVVHMLVSVLAACTPRLDVPLCRQTDKLERFQAMGAEGDPESFAK